MISSSAKDGACRKVMEIEFSGCHEQPGYHHSAENSLLAEVVSSIELKLWFDFLAEFTKIVVLFSLQTSVTIACYLNECSGTQHCLVNEVALGPQIALAQETIHVF